MGEIELVNIVRFLQGYLVTVNENERFRNSAETRGVILLTAVIAQSNLSVWEMGTGLVPYHTLSTICRKND